MDSYSGGRKRHTIIIKTPNNVKANAQYYIDNVLKPYLERKIPRIYQIKEEKVTFHHDKVTSHVAKLTIQYELENQYP